MCLRAAGAAEEQGLEMFPPPGSVEGDPFWDQIRDQLLGEPSNETKACHSPKPILFSTGEVRTHPCVPWGVQGPLGWAGTTDPNPSWVCQGNVCDVCWRTGREHSLHRLCRAAAPYGSQPIPVLRAWLGVCEPSPNPTL